MTEHNDEPLWFGMDVDAELARYAEQDRRRETEAPDGPSRKHSQRRSVLRAALPAIARGDLPPLPFAA